VDGEMKRRRAWRSRRSSQRTVRLQRPHWPS
jgi:hypothetical protein